ncbi:MAG: threonine--tRNA ligase [Candidatus Tagabacteria bacterium CG09_land_8_20_14_0_10_41_14]|uniref:Threonine--tRNA ligase n=2 Tax=Candidatus Tagaibacteriota TaxID=1817918 RepID=A0A2H0WKR7_9BACT|nr:MAG: threonine--tRNA ligase [Candidatus Tagabacteria bacterium CG09_land_8_20_14_0_10_41_14]PJE72991.1 MAG: threonine--tRNA ligase [Candidatus Tagabacteria bacterium CG10_big_fil_rev_8_21_14_0_10_40_13]
MKKDHIKLGKELDLFVQSDIVGRGLPLLTPKGATIKRALRNFIEEEEIKRGYQYTETPVMAKTELYKISGHLDHFRESMFIFNVGNEEMALRPMTCPHHFIIYKSRPRSYKELPLRYAELAELFRNEQTGEMHGLIRVRQFTLADAHIFCAPKQLGEEFKNVLDLIQYVMKCLGFKNHWYRFSKWNPKDKKKYIDNKKAWEESQKTMKAILDEMKLEYKEAEGEAAFYGPKLDIQMKNVFGKEDTIFTIQIDFALPERFDLIYEGQDGKKHRPMIIHRSSIGALERTMAMLLEYYQGSLPIWLSPVQALVTPISEKFNDYGQKVLAEFKQAALRAEIDSSNETLSKKILNSQKQKIPYILIVGEKERENNSVAVRSRKRDEGQMNIKDFIKHIKKEVEEKK